MVDGTGRFVSGLVVLCAGSLVVMGMLVEAPEASVAWPVPVSVAELPGWLALVAPYVLEA